MNYNKSPCFFAEPNGNVPLFLIGMIRIIKYFQRYPAKDRGSFLKGNTMFFRFAAFLSSSQTKDNFMIYIVRTKRPFVHIFLHFLILDEYIWSATDLHVGNG